MFYHLHKRPCIPIKWEIQTWCPVRCCRLSPQRDISQWPRSKLSNSMTNNRGCLLETLRGIPQQWKGSFNSYQVYSFMGTKIAIKGEKCVWSQADDLGASDPRVATAVNQKPCQPMQLDYNNSLNYFKIHNFDNDSKSTFFPAPCFIPLINLPVLSSSIFFTSERTSTFKEKNILSWKEPTRMKQSQSCSLKCWSTKNQC